MPTSPQQKTRLTQREACLPPRPTTFTIQLIGSALWAAAVTFILMASFESTKRQLLPGIDMWQSHLMTMLFTTVLAALVALLVLYRQTQLHDKAARQARALSLERQQAEEKYHAIFENAREGIFQSTPDGRFLTANPALARIYGYDSPKELIAAIGSIGHTLYSEPSQRDEFVGILGEHGSVTGFEAKVIRKDGTEVWTSESAQAVHGPDGTLLYYEGVVEDITERKGAEESLRESEERYRALFESNPHPMWVFDRETFAFLAVNDAAVAHYGYSRAEFLGMTIKDIRPPADVPALLKAVSRPHGSATHEGVWQHCKKDGTVIEVDITWHALSFGGRPAGLTLANDVTERRRIEAARARLVAILEATPDLVAISTIDGPVSYLNAAGRKLLGVGPNDTVSLTDHRPERERKRIMEEAIPTAIREHAWSGETVLLSRTGEEIVVSQVVLAHKTPSGEQLEYLSTIARDVRKQKQLEAEFRQAQKMEAIGQLAGGVAHDFNNLLTVITGYGELLAADFAEGSQTHEILQQIIAAGQRASGLTRQLLSFSRKQILAPRVVSLTDILAGMEKMLRPLLGEDVEFTTVVDEDVGPILADVGQIEQVVMNLAVNARDAMPRGGRLAIEARNVVLDETHLSAHPGARPGPYVLLAVADTGTGMDSATQARIFEPFFTTKGDNGTGLGLTTVYGIVQVSGGHIHVQSKLGQGTTFMVYLPRVGQKSPLVKSKHALIALPRGKEKILLVEDEDAIRGLAHQILRQVGYTVVEAVSGEEALRLAEEQRGQIDLLVTDVVMPKLSGRELADRLAVQQPRIKVLFLSGYTDDALLRYGVYVADTHFLQKPFSVGALIRMVRKVLDEPKVGQLTEIASIAH